MILTLRRNVHQCAQIALLARSLKKSLQIAGVAVECTSEKVNSLIGERQLAEGVPRRID